MRRTEEDLRIHVSSRLADLDPSIELVAVEPSGPESLRVFVDHPDGVDLALCERVTEALSDLLEDYSLEVSSPGPDRPLSRPEHFRRYLGRRARVRTREAIGGRRNFTGTIDAADDDGVRMVLGEGPVTIPHERIQRSNLVPEIPEGASK
ncbi:MAG: ribosome maturation factor RimP [Solirubrobacterales bacterium]